jgi:hypothetical protein
MPEDRQHELNALKGIAGIKPRAWREQRIIIIPDAQLSAVSPHIIKAVRKLKAAAEAMPKCSTRQNYKHLRKNQIIWLASIALLLFGIIANVAVSGSADVWQPRFYKASSQTFRVNSLLKVQA